MTPEVPALFHAWSVIDGFPTRWGPCDHLRMDWFMSKRLTPAVLYEDVIPGYPFDRRRAQIYRTAKERERLSMADSWFEETNAIDELFTASEVEVLRAYLETTHATSLEITRAELPFPPNRVGLGSLAVGGDDDFYRLDKTDGYSLSFPVWGYFDLSAPNVRFRNGRPPHFNFVIVRDDSATGLRLATENADGSLTMASDDSEGGSR